VVNCKTGMSKMHTLYIYFPILLTSINQINIPVSRKYCLQKKINCFSLIWYDLYKMDIWTNVVIITWTNGRPDKIAFQRPLLRWLLAAVSCKLYFTYMEHSIIYTRGTTYPVVRVSCVFWSMYISYTRH
jgi:hypothetical protein